jgi:hypothetical protein
MFVAVTLIGAALFAASLVIEKRRSATGPGADDRLVSGLRLAGVVVATLGFSGFAILSAVSVVPQL